MNSLSSENLPTTDLFSFLSFLCPLVKCHTFIFYFYAEKAAFIERSGRCSVASEFKCLLMQFLCFCRCWRCTCQPILRCTGERQPKSRGTRSTRTSCSIPASNTCTSPRRKRSNSLRLGGIDYSFLLNSFLCPSIHRTPLCRLIKKVRGSVMCLHLLSHFIHQVRDLMSLSFILSVLFDHLFIHWLTPIHPSTLPHRSQPLIYSLVLFLSGLLCFALHLLSPSVFLSFVLSSFSRHHSLPPRWSEIDVIDLEMN